MRRSALAGSLALVAALSGCSLNSEETGSSPAAAEGAHRGGVLRVGVTSPGGIDPLDAYEPAGKLISSALCDTVITLDPETGQIREALAKAWVVAESDGLASITVKLRHGITFTDGTELTSRDVNYSLGQVIAPSNGNYAAGLAATFFAGSFDKKANSILADPDADITVARSVSRHDFQMLSADGGSLRALAEAPLAPVAQRAREKDAAGFTRSPVCVGPYVLEKPYRAGDTTIVLKRSKGYYAKNVGYTSGGAGYADSIVFSIYPTATAALTAYDKGQVDVVQVPRGDVAGTKDVASRVYGVATGAEYLGLPGESTGPFADPDVRLALSKSIDRTKLVADVFGPAAEVANGFEPPALAITKGRSLKNKEVKGAPLATCSDRIPATPDLSSAKALLAAAAGREGAKPLTGFTLDVNSDAPYPAMARELAAQWKAGLGLDVRVTTTDWPAYAAKGAGGTGFTTPFRLRWSTDAMTPQPTYNNQQRFLAPLASEAGAGATGANWAHFSDRSFEFGLQSVAGTATEVGERGAAFAELAKTLCKQLPIIPLAFDRPAFLVRSSALGSARRTPVGRDGVLMLRELFVR